MKKLLEKLMFFSFISLVSCTTSHSSDQLERETKVMIDDLDILIYNEFVEFPAGGFLVSQSTIDKMTEMAESKGYSVLFRNVKLHTDNKKVSLDFSREGQQLLITKYQGDFVVFSEVFPKHRIDIFNKVSSR